MRQTLLLSVLALPLVGQVAVSVAPTGAETVRSYLGRRVPGVAVWSINACSQTDTRLASARVIVEAAGKGVVLFPAPLVDIVAARSQARSKSQATADIGSGLTLAGSWLIASGVVTASNQWQLALIGATGALRFMVGFFKAREPDQEKVAALRLPENIEIHAGGCWQGATLGAWNQASKAVVVEVR